MKTPSLPTGFAQGDGPHIFRWIPRPALRKQGWKAATLKDRDGKHLTMGQAIDACHAINARVEDWMDGLPVTGPWAHLAPEGLRESEATADDHSIGTLRDAYLSSPAYAALKPNTRADYRLLINRLLETLIGFECHPSRMGLHEEAEAVEQERYDRKMKLLLSQPVAGWVLEPHDKRKRPLVEAYNELGAQINERTGAPKVHQAYKVMAAAQAWLEWVKTETGAITKNPAKFKRATPEGRVVIWSADQVKRQLDACDRSGWHSIAFATRMALELSWSQIDLLKLTFGHFAYGWQTVDGHRKRVLRVRGKRIKTGNFTYTTLTDEGLKIYEEIRTYWRTANDMPGNAEPSPETPLFVVDKIKGRNDHGAVGNPWNSYYFRQTFIEMKTLCDPPLTDVRFQDLRDTAITFMLDAGLTPHQIQSRSQHSLQQIHNIIEKHYGLSTLENSDAAAANLNRHRALNASSSHA